MGRFFLKKLPTAGWAILLTIVIPGACGPDKEAIILEKVSEREAAFRQKKLAECRTLLLAEAEQTVDSLLLLEAISDLSDSLARLRPGKPAKPAPVLPIDSLTVKPLFEPASSTRGNR